MILQSKNLFIGFDSLNDSSHHFVIYYRHFPLFHCWKLNSLITELNNKWVVNKADFAIKSNYNLKKYHFDTLEDILSYFEVDFCKNHIGKNKIELPVIKQ